MFYEKNPTATQCVSVDGENFEKLSPPSPSSFHLPHSSSLLYSGDSSSTSTISSTILEKTVGRKAQGDTLVAKVQSLQNETVLLKGAINEGKLDAETVRVTLDKMLQEHMHLATTVATVTTSLEAVNSQSKGRAARHIATRYTSLGAELHVLAEHLLDLERTLHTANLPTSITTITSSSCSSIKINNDSKSPCLPDIYLTPSRPIHYSVSPVTSELFHSPPGSSLSSLPKSSESPSSPGYHGSPESPSPPESLSSPGYHGSPSPPVSPSSLSSLSELDPFTPDTAPPSSHLLSELIIHSPIHHLTPSPCADSGIASSSGPHTAPSSLPTLSPPPPLSSHSSTHTPSPQHLTITMEDIDAMKAELAKLREEIRNTSNWSHSLNHDLHASSSSNTQNVSPSYTCRETGLTGITGFVYSSPSSPTVSYHSGLDFIPSHRSSDSIPDHRHSVSVPHYRPSESNLAVSRPYLSVSRPRSQTASLTQTHHQLSNTTPHRPLHSKSIHRDQQNGIGTTYMSRLRTNTRAVQTTPTTPNTCFGTKTSNIQSGTERFPHGLYSSPSFISNHFSPSQFPTNFTPHLLVNTIHHSPSYPHPTTIHLPTHLTHTTPSRATHLPKARTMTSDAGHYNYYSHNTHY